MNSPPNAPKPNHLLEATTYDCASTSNVRHEKKPVDRHSVRLRSAKPAQDEGLVFARYLDEAAEGFFRFMLGRGAGQIIARAFVLPDHDLSYQNVTFAERDNAVVAMVSGFTAEQHRRSSLQPLKEAAGRFNLRMRIVLMLFAPLMRVIDSIADGDFYLQAIAVDEALRGDGLGNLLVDSLEHRARESGAKRLSLDVSASNQGAIRFYGHRGMTIESQWPERLKLPALKFYRMTKELKYERSTKVPRSFGVLTGDSAETTLCHDP